MEELLVAQIKNKSNNANSEVTVMDSSKKMSPEQIQNRKRTTINNIAERQMFGFVSNNYKNKFKSK